MKQKILFIRMLWSVLRNKQSGWIFLRMGYEVQKDFLNNTKDVEVAIRYIGVDKRVIEKIVKRLQSDKSNQSDQ
jgi:hypothetical protein